MQYCSQKGNEGNIGTQIFNQPFCGHKKNHSILLKKILDNVVNDWIRLLLRGPITTLEVKLVDPWAAGEPPPAVGVQQVLPRVPLPREALLVLPNRSDARLQP